MADAKTRSTGVGPTEFVASVEPVAKRSDAEALLALFGDVTGVEPRMWGPAIIGYGSYHYRYATGREGDWMRVGFSPRKARHSLYLLGCGEESAGEAFEPLLARLGKHTRGVGCLYVNRLADVKLGVLEEIVRTSWTRSFETWPES